MHVRPRSALAACAMALLAVAAPAAAATPSPSPSPPAASGPRSTIGGAELASTGLVIHRGATTPALPATVIVPGWIVADLDTGDVLAARDPHGRYRPASTLKTLTALSLLPSEPEAETYVPTVAMATIEGTRVGVEAGKTYTRQEILEGMMLSSGNDAAEAFAAGFPGGRTAALAEMNSVAKHLQADDTLARTPSGLDADGQLSSPYDLALIARQLLKDPVLGPIVAKPSSTFPCTHGPSCKKGSFQIQNHNHVVTSLKGALGVKSGGTSLAQLVVVGAVAGNGHRIVAVTMYAQSIPFTQNIDLLKWGLAADGTVTPVGHLVDPLPVEQAAPAQPLSSAAKKATAIAKAAHARHSSHWQLLLLLASLAVAAVAVLRRRGRGMPRPADTPLVDPWARVSAVVTPAAPPGRAVPFDQDEDPSAGRTVSSTVRVRPAAVPVDPSRVPGVRPPQTP